MPRAYCPKCGAEVPVDDQGICHVGHEVDLAAATGNEDLASAARALEAEFEDQQPDEPEPWVGEIDDPAEPTRSGEDPVGDDGPPGVGREADEELPPAARPQARTPYDSEGWQPASSNPVGPGPQPPPEPALPADDLDDDFGLEDLEAAVAELEVEERGDLAGPAAVPTETPDGPMPESPRPESPPERSPEPEDEPEPSEPEPEKERDRDGGPDEDAEEPDDGEPEAAEEEPSPEIDLANFTARGGRVGEGGKKRGLFGFGR